jgi:peptide/nickel transport system ATP-binding protein
MIDAGRALDVKHLSVSFPLRSGFGKKGRRLNAVRDVSLYVDQGETLSLVGESGSGKSTTARAILRLLEPDCGTVCINGIDITRLDRRHLRAARRNVQMVFQDPYSSLNPSMLVGDSVAEPLTVHEKLSRRERDDRVVQLLERVGLRADHAARYPYEFSGGQRQRITIARALAVRPALVVCDEAVSALDVSTQVQIVELLQELQASEGVAYLFIAHDLGIVRTVSHRVAVMYLGQIVEEGSTKEIFDTPAHPYTKALLSAVPVANPARQRARKLQRITLAGDPPDPSNPPSGCAFHERCPVAIHRRLSPARSV